MNEQEKAYVEEKADEILMLLLNKSVGEASMDDLKAFILSIIKDCQAKVDYDFIKKEAGLLVSRFDCECGLTHLQKIGIRTVLTEKGDLWDILQRAGVEVEE